MILRVLIAAALAATALAPAGEARPRGQDQAAAFNATKQGRFLPLRAIEGRVVPQMRGFTYIGPELNVASAIYRLKFMRGAQLVWIDIDARTGEVLGRTGF
jgi:hypothetical protein